MGFLSTLLKSLVPTILSWLAKNAGQLIRGTINKIKDSTEERRVKKKNKKLVDLQRQLEIAIEKRDEKEIVKLHVAINSIK